MCSNIWSSPENGVSIQKRHYDILLNSEIPMYLLNSYGLCLSSSLHTPFWALKQCRKNKIFPKFFWIAYWNAIASISHISLCQVIHLFSSLHSSRFWVIIYPIALKHTLYLSSFFCLLCYICLQLKFIFHCIFIIFFIFLYFY